MYDGRSCGRCVLLLLAVQYGGVWGEITCLESYSVLFAKFAKFEASVQVR